jgi:hypothetical protein
LEENAMTSPLIYISTWGIKEGRLEDYKSFASELVELVEAREPQLIAFNVFLDESESEMTSIQVHPDAASMDTHMEVVGAILGEDMVEWAERADFLEPKRFEVYGAPNVALLEADQPAVEAGIPRTIKPVHLVGFARSFSR